MRCGIESTDCLQLPRDAMVDSKNGLHMEVSADANLSGFDALAGKLMFEARPRRRGNERLPMTEYDKIAQVAYSSITSARSHDANG
jgi:hypothetical protein